jgi:hypothetical protein
MQAGEPAVGIRLRINLDRDSRSFSLGRHFVEIPDSKVQHPNLLGIPEKYLLVSAKGAKTVESQAVGSGAPGGKH